MKVHFGIRTEWDGIHLVGTPADIFFVRHAMLNKSITAAGGNGDDSDFELQLSDHSKLHIFSSGRGAEIVYCPPDTRRGDHALPMAVAA
jgi:hypothetical protein